MVTLCKNNSTAAVSVFIVSFMLNLLYFLYELPFRQSYSIFIGVANILCLMGALWKGEIIEVNLLCSCHSVPSHLSLKC